MFGITISEKNTQTNTHTNIMSTPSSSAVRALALEYKSLQEEPVEGFRVKLLNDDNLFEWEVAIFGPPDTLYQGGYFKVSVFSLHLSRPNQPPQTTPLPHVHVSLFSVAQSKPFPGVLVSGALYGYRRWCEFVAWIHVWKPFFMLRDAIRCGIQIYMYVRRCLSLRSYVRMYIRLHCVDGVLSVCAAAWLTQKKSKERISSGEIARTMGIDDENCAFRVYAAMHTQCTRGNIIIIDSVFSLVSSACWLAASSHFSSIRRTLNATATRTFFFFFSRSISFHNTYCINVTLVGDCEHVSVCAR